ncbi:baeRF7 domain-containing protein [Algoriphagus namhaensis]
MKIFGKDQFLELAEMRADNFVTIYIPTSRVSTNDYKEDRTHLKNSLKTLKEELSEVYHMDDQDIQRLLKPAQDILDDLDFWRDNSDLLVLFLWNRQMKVLRLPIAQAETKYMISDRPYLLPLVPELNDNGHFYLLLLNLDQIRLYGVTRSVIQEIKLDPQEVALSFTAEEEQDENQQSLQGQGGVGESDAMYHGHGKGSDEAKKVAIQNYFHRMTNMLEPILNQNPLPLYIAGVDYLGSLFRNACDYQHLRDGQITGSFTGDEMGDLHVKAWNLAEPDFQKERMTRMKNFDQLETQDLALADDQAKILKAALTGAVETLMVNDSIPQIWGTYDAQKYTIEISEKKQKGHHCLIDLAAVQVIQSGGKVYLEESAEVPGKDHKLACTLRYPLGSA